MRTYPELSDWHLHSHFSSDSTETPENIIKNAINMQLKSICFTEHNDYDYPLEDGNVVFALDYDKYTDELLELKERYKMISLLELVSNRDFFLLLKIKSTTTTLLADLIL